ncbi:hypothetical protein P168DRAFT_279989 [Aspergillus campestris IBT 28561]|uniref:FHA domain-containing protein n=1 Tax=Aspergillus campestris (strain IBT 28561) TaxID=1392248 RepID=A0A2I1D9K1_ASPC2|nr:uncharacterized protein P168DRAFT_279989 [Aspergillus campestris IBT 28561]PKY06571.1 hypothetical protein P168DRAFT_279989 [Aspergillus campestris IBT 28561]
MTAVASPPSVQSGSRLGWYDPGNGGQGPLSSMNAEEVSRMFMPRKTVQRSNSSSSLASTTSSTSTVAAHPQTADAAQNSNSESSTWSSKKKPSRGIWPNSKSDPVAGVSNARPQVMPAFSGPAAASTMSALQQPSSIVPSQHMLQSPQQNGVRAGSAPSGDPPAVLTLIPLNGTFEKKQINVPFYPEVLRIGRQTNAKTVPTPMNGYFDSKVLSRQHAEIWADKTGKIWIRDIKSSNGTFVSGKRLSPENRESEPHELREGDILELGIDIVSEDGKTVVHHKVCAKVEHAGIYSSLPNILDLTLGDLDPSSGNGLLPSPLSQPLAHLRGRAGSTMSNRSTQSNASSQFNAMQQQRQMNYWNSPISIEQVVKRLTNEMKQAKQQSQDLRQTDDFLTTIMKNGPPEKEKVKHSPAESSASRQMNGRPKMPRVDSFSRFSEPPAPPPQQPLPEKPDALPRNGVDAMSPLKRSDTTDTEKQKFGPASPAISRESSQILSLIEALSSAKRELDSQGARVKELENLLLQERQAREAAEERAGRLEIRPDHDVQANVTGPPLDSHAGELQKAPSENRDLDSALVVEQLTESTGESTDVDEPTDRHTDQLKQRLDFVMAEMEEMRQQVAVFKDRAQKAEDETTETRKSLTEMIETLRRERADGETVGQPISAAPDGIPPSGSALPGEGEDKGAEAKSSEKQDSLLSPQSSTAFATQKPRHAALEQSSPYASMLGVVLLGVGLMAYLNGWQKMER